MAVTMLIGISRIAKSARVQSRPAAMVRLAQSVARALRKATASSAITSTKIAGRISRRVLNKAWVVAASTTGLPVIQTASAPPICSTRSRIRPG